MSAVSPASRWLGRNYVALIVATYMFTPELRRFIDGLHGGYQQVSPIMILPLAVQMPLVVAVFRGGRLNRIPSSMLFFAFAWTAACAYGAVVGYAMGNGVGAFYDAANFALPMWSGLWIASQAEDAATLLNRFSKTLLLFATISAAYGIYQYVNPPSWDILWMQGVNMVSLGKPQAFGFRIFGTMNDAVSLSLVLMAAFVLNLNRLRGLRPLTILQLLIIVAALGLTAVRQSWIGLVIGLVVYAILSPRRARVLPVLGFVTALATGLIFNLSAFLGVEGNPVVDRITTFGSLASDQSLTERGGFTNAVLEGATRNPLGYGFGSMGHGAVLATGDLTVADNGYAVRVYEFGVPGSLLFYFVIFGTLLLVLLAFVRRWDTPTVMEVTPPVAALSIALIAIELASDVHLGVMGVLYWVGLGLFFKARAEASPAHLQPAPPTPLRYGVGAGLVRR